MLLVRLQALRRPPVSVCQWKVSIGPSLDPPGAVRDSKLATSKSPYGLHNVCNITWLIMLRV